MDNSAGIRHCRFQYHVHLVVVTSTMYEFFGIFHQQLVGLYRYVYAI